MKDIAALLRAHPFVEGLDAGTVAFIGGCASNAVFAPGAFVFREGDSADRFFLLREGRVALESHRPGQAPLVVLTIGPGELLGASWLIPPNRYAFDARAVDRVRAFAFDARCLREKCDSDPAVGYAMMKRFVPVVVARLQRARLQALDLEGDPGAP